MKNSNVSESPLEAAAGAAGPHAVDAFKLLSDETRLAILLALWEAYDPHAEDNSVPFSKLYDRVAVRDSANFTYHLNKLVGHYVEDTDDGYQLRNSGMQIVRTVIAGSGLEDRRLPRTEIPRSCDHCSAPVELSYEDERLYQICTECEGNIGPESTEQAPEGTLTVYDNFNPAGLVHRTPEEVFVAGTIEYMRTVTLLIRGVCPECSGPIEESLNVCESHGASPGELCSTCGTSMRGGWNEARVSYTCSVCKRNGSYPAWVAVYDHPAIIAFYYEHGLETTYGLDDPEVCGRIWNHLKMEQTLVSEDPVRIRVTASYEGEDLHLSLDDTLEVIDMNPETRKASRDQSEDVSPSGSSSVRSRNGRRTVDGIELPDKGECLQQIRRRWPNGAICPHCNGSNTLKKGTTSKDAQRYGCHECGGTFNDLTGTVFAGHRLSLPEMVHIIRQMDRRTTARIARQLDRSYKSVLDFVHEVRDAYDGESESIVPPTVTGSKAS